ncbi:MAG: copper resistance protein NlpE [Spirochaetaceae bacterium]|jgi:uncharacterized lipoprotein NlpE involved in copper resistance|nr:copper resistance protein NlpE [Spirochaetaceae bacterium]
MKKAIVVLMAAFFVLGLGACKPKNQSAGVAVDAAHNSMNSVNWDGVYTGTIPAADGPGINVKLTLNPDESYEITYEYIDRESVFTASGKFGWDETGSIITLDTREFARFYQVGENMLFQLDTEGNPITGLLADNYRLFKTL